MAITIAFALQKGGVGKTTTTAALAMELATTGSRVLCVDLDPQSNLTQTLGVTVGPDEPTIYEVMLNQDHDPRFAITTTDFGVDLLPATLALAGAELMFASRFGRELLLRTALAQLAGDYDYMLIDSPPSLGLFTVNALVAADTILVPLQAHVFALQAVGQLADTIRIVRQLNPQIHIGGIAITMVDKRTSLNSEVEAAARDAYGSLVFATTIPFNIKLAEAPAAGKPVTAYAAHSTGAAAYKALAEEVRNRWPAN